MRCSLNCLRLPLIYEIWLTLGFLTGIIRLHLRIGTRCVMIILRLGRHVIALAKAHIYCVDLLFDFHSLNQIVGENRTVFSWTQTIDRQFIA